MFSSNKELNGRSGSMFCVCIVLSVGSCRSTCLIVCVMERAHNKRDDIVLSSVYACFLIYIRTLWRGLSYCSLAGVFSIVEQSTQVSATIYVQFCMAKLTM